MNLEQAIDIARASRSQAEAEFFDHLRIPSISALTRHAGDCRPAAKNLVNQLQRIGFAASLVEGDGPHNVRAEWLGAPGNPAPPSSRHVPPQLLGKLLGADSSVSSGASFLLKRRLAT